MKHLAIFHGEMHSKVYKFDRYKGIYPRYHYHSNFLANIEPEFYDASKLLGRKEFIRFEIDNPPIEIHEKVYIEKIDKTVNITDRVRNASGGYIYYTDYIIELIEDEDTEKSKIKAQKLQEEYLVSQKEEEIIENKQINKKWYQFWK